MDLLTYLLDVAAGLAGLTRFNQRGVIYATWNICFQLVFNKYSCIEDDWSRVFLQSRCPSCYPGNIVKTLKGMEQDFM